MRTARDIRARIVGGVGAVGLAVGLLAAAPAAAAPADGGDDSWGGTKLELRVADVADVAHAPRTATLTCDPPGGTHPEPAAACRDIAIAGGDFADLPGDPDIRACLDIYDPVRATATGRWRGRRVDFAHTYANACQMQLATGPVFQLDRGPIIGPA